jgi:hypothetical protein
MVDCIVIVLITVPLPLCCVYLVSNTSVCVSGTLGDILAAGESHSDIRREMLHLRRRAGRTAYAEATKFMEQCPSCKLLAPKIFKY